jgi:hypothetical protein
VLIDQRDWAMFHFRSRVSFGMDVADFLELQRPFECGWEKIIAAELKNIRCILKFPRDLLDLLFRVQC